MMTLKAVLVTSREMVGGDWSGHVALRILTVGEGAEHLYESIRRGRMLWPCVGLQKILFQFFAAVFLRLCGSVQGVDDC